MINRINDIINYARDEKVETTIISLEQEPKELYDIVENLKQKIKRTQYEDFSKISNYDLFKLYFCFNNDTMSLIESGQAHYFESPQSYNELYDIIEESKDYIDSWTFQTHYPTIRKAIDSKNQIELINACQELGLNPYITSYDIKQVLIAMTNLLFYKKEIQKIQISNKTTSLKTKEIRELYLKILSETITNIIQRYESTKKFYKERKVNCKKKIQYINELLKTAESGILCNMDLIEGEWHKYLSPSILNPLYDHLLDNQYKRYQTIMETNKLLNDKISETPFINFLYQHEIDPSSMDENVLKQANDFEIEELVMKIEFFQKIGYTLQEILTKYIQMIYSIELTKIKKINTYLDRNIIKKETIKNNVNIINLINTIDINYSILKPIIDINSIYYDDSILILEPIEIKRRLSILSLYNNLSPNNYMFLLSNIRYIKIYDLMLEKNIPLYLFITICKQYDPMLTIKKIIICKQLDIPYEKNGILIKEIRSINSFMCPDEEIDSYIDNSTQFYLTKGIITSEVTDITKIELVKKLDIYHKDNDTYVFGETIISRPKVLRNLQTIKNNKEDINTNLFFAMITSSILDESDLQTLKSVVSQKNISI